MAMELAKAHTWLKEAKAAADEKMADYLRVRDDYAHMEPDALRFMSDVMRAHQLAKDAVAHLSATRSHIAKMIPNVLAGNMGTLQ